MTDLDFQLALKLQQELEHESRRNVDHDAQVALKLQAAFDQERKSAPQTNTKDVSLAFQLQEQFNDEVATEKFSNGLVYKNTKNNLNSSKSLIDPSWELVDPTPNIHTLFVAFNERYFWNKLLTVAVSWSKRMTTCAGICSYRGRGGECNITLSEPLLKLRPRKDLVETLLHEMIHAYLFVTHNNKDRDGHGPEFHKHMYRINGEAGTNITVYHDFHDEVRLYKQHWWKCNGPCQHRKPYYGMVRRATNRAPGPNDFWWGEHSRSCGGTFVKVREPEKPEKKKKAEKEIKPVKGPSNSIKKYFPVSPKNKAISSQNPIKPSTAQNIFNDNSKVKNIHGFHDIDKLTPKSSKASSNSNINGFHNIGNTNYNSKGGTSTRYNGSTVVINKKPSTVTKAAVKSPIVKEKPTSVSSPPQHTDYAIVRNHWLNKFGNTSDTSSPPKRARIETEDEEVLHDNIILVNCPVCEKGVPDGQLDEHLNKCMDEHTHCEICNKNVPNGDYEEHKTECSRKGCVECDICGELIKRPHLERHKIDCLHEISMSLNESNDFKECHLCKSSVDPDIFDRHLETCLLRQMNDMQESLDTIPCLVCNKTVPKSDLKAHLNECMSDGIFLDKSEADAFVADNSLMEVYDGSKGKQSSILISDADDESSSADDESNGFVLSDAQAKEYVKQGKKVYGCPVCDKKVLMDRMNDHLDMCAGI